MDYILRVLTFTRVKYTVIKACNNKIEQGENNELFYVCVCSYLGGKKSFITFTVNLQCPTRIEGIMELIVFKVSNCSAQYKYHDYLLRLTEKNRNSISWDVFLFS